jgi:hypothetical protein
VAEYGRIVLDGGKTHKRWNRARTMPAMIQTALPVLNPPPQINATDSLASSSKCCAGRTLPKWDCWMALGGLIFRVSLP